MKLNEIILCKGRLVETDRQKLPKGVLCRVAYPICNIGEKNQNNRVYSKEVWERVLADESLQRKMKERTLFGQAEHPAETQSDLQLTSHVITNTWIDESTDKVMQEMDVLETPCGKIIDTLLEAGCLVGVSTRAEGELEEMNEGEEDSYFNVIPESYVYVATDFTADPSTFDVTPAKYEQSVVKDIKLGLKANKLARHFATVLLESMKSPEAKKVLETIQKEDKKVEAIKGLKVKVIEGDHKDSVGTIEKIEENRISLHLDDGTSISVEATRVVTDDGQVEIILPSGPEIPLEAELDVTPAEEEPGEEDTMTDLGNTGMGMSAGDTTEEFESKEEVSEVKDVRGTILSKGDKVFADGGKVQGKITSINTDGTIDIHHADAHQGPVIDTFDIKGREVTKLGENKMGVDSVKDVKAGIKQVTAALKDKDYEAAAKALDDVADDAAHGAKSARKMKRANDTKADDDKKKAEEAKVEEDEVGRELSKDLDKETDKAIIDAMKSAGEEKVEEETVDEVLEYSVKYKNKEGMVKTHPVTASNTIEASEKAQQDLGEEAKIVSVDVVAMESKMDEGHQWNIGDEMSWHGRAGKVVGKSADGKSYKVHFLDSDEIEWIDVVEARVTEVDEEEIAEKIVNVDGKWQVQSEGGEDLGTYSTKKVATEIDNTIKAQQKLCQVNHFKKKKNESTSITDTIRELRISEAGMKAEREKAIELLEEIEEKTKTSDTTKALEIKVLINKLRDIQFRENLEVNALRKLIEIRSRSLQIAIRTVKGLHCKFKKDMGILVQQVKEQDIKIKKIATEYVVKLRDKTNEIEESYKKEFIKRYVNFKIESSGLKIHESSQALLEKKGTVEEVDAIFEEIRDAMRRNALHSSPLNEINVENNTETKDPLRESIGNVIKSTGF